MKVLMINGSPNEHGCTYTALSELQNALHSHGIETELLYLGKKPVAGCICCRHCRESDGRCVFDDQVNEIGARLDEFDAIVAGSPVYYAGPSGQICAFLDRLFFCNQSRMAGKLAASVVSCRRGGATAAFDRLNKYFTIANMMVVGSQYWNQVHGHDPETVVQDEEGMQTMRALGENMAWIIKCLKAAKEAGVPDPVYEARVSTNYIR